MERLSTAALASRGRGGHSAQVSQQPIELILLRHLATRLVVPVFVVDAAGEMIYFNEPAERVLGRRYDEIRRMPFEEWTTAFMPHGEEAPLTADELPLAIAVREGRPAHREITIKDAEGKSRRIGVTAFPVEAGAGERVGAVAMFWELEAA